MSLRAILQDSRWGALIAVVMIVAAGLIFSQTSGSSRGERQYWYLDVQTGELFVSDANLPPTPAPSGGEGVQAFVYSCDACSEDQRQVVYLEKYTDEGKAYIKDTPLDDDSVNPGHMVALPPTDGGEIEWSNAESIRGHMIYNRLASMCSGRPNRCEP